MFLLWSVACSYISSMYQVFVSYIRRYVLTSISSSLLLSKFMFSSPIFGDMFLLREYRQTNHWSVCVFVSYIRRYVLTDAKNDIQPSKKQFSSPIFGDMFLLLFDQLVDISTIIDIFNGTLNGQ